VARRLPGQLTCGELGRSEATTILVPSGAPATQPEMAWPLKFKGRTDKNKKMIFFYPDNPLTFPDTTKVKDHCDGKYMSYLRESSLQSTGFEWHYGMPTASHKSRKQLLIC